MPRDHGRPATQPYGANQGGGGDQPNYANPVYAHNNPHFNDGNDDYAEVADENEVEVPYEEPCARQSVVYDNGEALGASRQCAQITSGGRCPKMAAAGAERCSKHICSKEGCTKSKSSKTPFCRAHTPTQSMQPSKRLEFGGETGKDAEDVSNV